nr:MAG TPA: hypothetical protein [Caudoviricetes sp.]
MRSDDDTALTRNGTLQHKGPPDTFNLLRAQSNYLVS